MARFRFSFLSDMTGLYRFRPRGRRPTTAVLERVAEAIVTNLPACRERWWITQGSRREIGLVNRSIETRSLDGGDGVLAKVTLKRRRAAARIVAAGYDAGSGKVTLALDDGCTLSLTAGQHLEEAEEW